MFPYSIYSYITVYFSVLLPSLIFRLWAVTIIYNFKFSLEELIYSRTLLSDEPLFSVFMGLLGFPGSGQVLL